MNKQIIIGAFLALFGFSVAKSQSPAHKDEHGHAHEEEHEHKKEHGEEKHEAKENHAHGEDEKHAHGEHDEKKDEHAHEEGDEHGEEEAAPAVGADKGIIAASAEEGIKLSPQALKNFEIKSVSYAGGQLSLAKSAIFYGLQERRHHSQRKLT